MQKIATMTIIRGNGGCAAYMDGIINTELHRQQQRASAIERHRDNLLADRLAELNARMRPKRSLLRRATEPITNAWCMLCAVTLNLGEIVINWLKIHRFIEDAE